MKLSINLVPILIITMTFLSFTKQSEDETFSLTIKVEHLKNSDGVVQFSLYNKKGTIPDEKFKKYYKKRFPE